MFMWRWALSATYAYGAGQALGAERLTLVRRWPVLGAEHLTLVRCWALSIDLYVWRSVPVQALSAAWATAHALGLTVSKVAQAHPIHLVSRLDVYPRW